MAKNDLQICWMTYYNCVHFIQRESIYWERLHNLSRTRCQREWCFNKCHQRNLRKNNLLLKKKIYHKLKWKFSILGGFFCDILRELFILARTLSQETYIHFAITNSSVASLFRLLASSIRDFWLDPQSRN